LLKFRKPPALPVVMTHLNQLVKPLFPSRRFSTMVHITGRNILRSNTLHIIIIPYLTPNQHNFLLSTLHAIPALQTENLPNITL
jgi:hypothetical protein